MNTAQIQGIIRAIITAIGGVATAVGYLNSVDWVGLAGAAATLAGTAWSIYSNSTKSVITQAADSPEVKEIVVRSPALALSIENTKVVKK